jgi:precorrin-8X/cobalt-precorrin-8 methylmutase
MVRLDYIRDPDTIYRQSFDAIGMLEELQGLDAGFRDVAIRIVHACGMPEIVEDLRHSDGFLLAGRRALERGAPILCDVESVRSGIISRLLPANCVTHCRIDTPQIRALAKRENTTRAAAQIDQWGEFVAGSILVVGNAPTALFRVLENAANGGPKPALILGFPVGFVGAAESKAELATDSRGIPFLTLLGRRGGSAMAAAAMNAVAAGLAT